MNLTPSKRAYNLALLPAGCFCGVLLLTASTDAGVFAPACSILVTTDASGVITSWTCPRPSDCTAPEVCNEWQMGAPPGGWSGKCLCGDPDHEHTWKNNQACTSQISAPPGQQPTLKCYDMFCGSQEQGTCKEEIDPPPGPNLTEQGGWCPCTPP